MSETRQNKRGPRGEVSSSAMSVPCRLSRVSALDDYERLVIFRGIGQIVNTLILIEAMFLMLEKSLETQKQKIMNFIVSGLNGSYTHGFLVRLIDTNIFVFLSGIDQRTRSIRSDIE